jgi:pimeloyl-ACP methyl ester carboxylesterase
MDGWFEPATRRADIRRDLAKYWVSAPDSATLLAWSDRMRGFTRPVLVVWATEDRLMPREHGRRLAELYPDSRLVEVDDSYTLVPEDQPERLAVVLLDFLAETDQRQPSRLEGGD